MTGRRLGVVAVALALASTVAGVQSGRVIAGSASWTYPTDCASVQACIDLATPGATVYMSADAVGQVASISKSISLKSINATHYKIDSVGIVDSSTPLFATVAGLDINLILDASLGHVSGSSVNLRNNIVRGQANVSATIHLTAAGTASFNVENNTAHILGDSDALSVFTQMTSGTATFNFLGNRLDGHGSTTSGSGIEMTFEDSGQVVGNVYNNSIWDVARVHAGAVAGISIVPRDTVKADLNVVGNTVELSDTDGLQQRNTLVAGGQLALDVFNNTFSHAAVFGLRLDNGTAVPTAFRAGYNNYFANASGNLRDGLSLGSNNLGANPKFVNTAAGDLRLKKISGLINKGQVCSPGGIANPDAKNLNRLNGSSVDIGAFEQGSGAVTGMVLVGDNNSNNQSGTAGADILCGYGGQDLQSGGDGNDYIDGGDQNDLQLGGTGADRMFGGKGNDRLCANDGTGTDSIDGGKGTDSYKVDAGDVKKAVETALASCFI